MSETIDPIAAFGAVEIRVATVRSALPFPEARVPALKLELDFGETGTRWSSAQITDNYTAADLVGTQVLAVTSLPPKRIAGFRSECLTVGVAAADGSVVLVRPDRPVPEGARLY